MLRRTGEITRWDLRTQATWLKQQQEYRAAGNAYQEAALTAGGTYVDWCHAATMYTVVSEDDLVLSTARACIEGGLGEQDSTGTLADAHRQIADVLNQRNVFTEALTHAKEATALNATDPFAFDTLAASLLGLRRLHEGESAAKQALRLSDGKYSWMHFRLGSIYFEMENWDAARRSYEKASELEPQDPAAAYNVALCYTRLGYYRDAARWYEEYLRRKPNASDRAHILERIRILRSR